MSADDDLTARLVDDTLRLMRVESPSADLAALGRCVEEIDRWATPLLGTAPERLDVGGGRPALRWTWPVRRGDQGRVLLLCHVDTVWPIGTITRLPARVEDERVLGPGGYDMKAGLAMAVRALERLRADDAGALAGVTLLCTTDEEIGTDDSLATILAAAAEADAVLVLEGAGPQGQWKTARKGIGMFTIEVAGRAAHAGLEPHKGINATVELAHQILAVDSAADWEAGTSVVPTVATAGTTINTVPATGRLRVDVRAWTAAELERVGESIRGLTPRVDGAELTVTGGINRLPLESPMAMPVYRRAVAVATRLGWPSPGECGVGGASDGNFTAAAGTPTLDGLGPVGAGAHADDEHVFVPEMAPRTRLLAGLVADLLRTPPTR